MMKISLRKKTCFLLAAFTIISALLLMLAIGIGFKTFYLEYRKDTLISMSKDIGRMYREAGTDKAEQFDRLSQQNSSVIYIVDNQHLVYSSMPNRESRRLRDSRYLLPQDCKGSILMGMSRR